MDTNNQVDALRFYLRQCWRLRRRGRDPLALSQRDEAALWARSEAAAARLQRVIDLQPVPVLVRRRIPGPPRRMGLN
jgi:hypothetical protein